MSSPYAFWFLFSLNYHILGDSSVTKLLGTGHICYRAHRFGKCLAFQTILSTSMVHHLCIIYLKWQLGKSYRDCWTSSKWLGLNVSWKRLSLRSKTWAWSPFLLANKSTTFHRWDTLTWNSDWLNPRQVFSNLFICSLLYRLSLITLRWTVNFERSFAFP